MAAEKKELPKTEVSLPSGSKLVIQIAPFAEAKALYQALLRELRATPVNVETQMISFYKDIFAGGFSSPHVEACLWKCFERCTIDGLKIDKDTFEPIERRDDYIQVCMAVGRANVFPFVKSLYASYLEITEALTKNEIQASKSKTTT